MRNTTMKFGIALLAALAISSVQALPITGKIQFTAAGTFVDADGDVASGASDATGVDFGNMGFGDGIGIVAGGSAAPTGSILDMILAGGGGLPLFMQMFDFNLADAPPLPQWAIAPVSVNGQAGALVFQILSGGVVDGGSESFFDLAGVGMFSFVCAGPASVCSENLDPALHAFEDTIGSWSISNSAGGLVVGINVPAPATIGFLGLALLGLGVIRRRKTL